MAQNFTVKWQNENGTVHLWSAESVSITQPGRDDGGEYRPMLVCFGSETIENMTIDSGTVYIMNQQGRTIERVYLDLRSVHLNKTGIPADQLDQLANSVAVAERSVA